jgi:hypothetical protein
VSDCNEQNQDPNRNYIGRYRGQVISNIDPENTGRLLVSVPDVLGSAPCIWAAPAPAFAGTQQGLYAIPPIGGGVWIEFEQGDPDYPIWTGSFRGSAAETPAMALAAPPAAPPVVMQSIAQNRMIVSGVPADGVTLETSLGAAGPRIQITTVGIIISDGQGGMITMTGGLVTVNGGALIIR